ncbi:MAG: glycosyltransferase family 4 protein [Chlamydiales bacterium]
MTHSSLDAWFGGVAARLCGIPVVRLRHLSTPTRAGLNSYLLYKKLADFVVTTSTSAASLILEQTRLPKEKCLCVPTGVEPSELKVSQAEVKKFREQLGVSHEDCLVGTACFVRSWKGVQDLLQAAALLKGEKRIKWVIIGGGYIDQYIPLARELGLEKQVIFTGHLDIPYAAIAALDIFLLLSTAHEGISQASLQAAYLARPLITTPIGGLPEVCLDGKTGLIVPPRSPERVAEAVLALARDTERRISFGSAGKKLVEEKFIFTYTLNQMERIYTLMEARKK